MMLLTSDLHLTDKPKDAYRFKIFPFLDKLITEYGVKGLFILGDLTDMKDKHSARLVYEIFSRLFTIMSLHKDLHIVLLMGNHDYIDPRRPFFGFLNYAERITFVFDITSYHIDGIGDHILLLPHTKTPGLDWKNLNLHDCGYIFMHQTMTGALASNDYPMEGLPRDYFSLDKTDAKIYSGDIHVPQKVGRVNYVGSPYHVHFGDKFKPRVLLIDALTIKSLPTDMMQKHSVRIRHPEALLAMENLSEGDQIKVRLQLSKSELVDWHPLRRQVIDICEKLKIDLYAVELEERVRNKLKVDDDVDALIEMASAAPEDAFARFVKREKISADLAVVGKELLE